MTENNNTNKPVHPVFIFAPTARCGITLLQRLLNSSRRIIVYGENSLLINTLPNNVFYFNAYAKQHNQARQRLLSGEYDFWSSAVWPDSSVWCGTVIKSIEMFLKVYQDESSKYGFDKWGIKSPVDDSRTCAFYFQTFPASKIIFIYRHIVDVMMSYKSRKWIPNLSACSDIAQQWCKNVNYMLNGDVPNRVIVLKYEDLLANKDEYVERIENLIGISGIDKSVFNRKVNTFQGDKQFGHSPNQYIEPDELTSEEIDVIKNIADEFLAKCNYPSVEDRVKEKLSKRKEPALSASES